jgi:hypothetical protein
MYRYLGSPVPVFMALLVFCLPRPALADDVPWDPEDGDPPVFQPVFLGEKNYNEAWEFYFRFADGTFFSAQMSVFNVGSSDHRALVVGKLTTPDGLELVLKNGRKRDEWSYDPEVFDLRVENHRFYQDGDDFKLVVKNVNGEVEITATPVLDPWDIGYTSRKEGRKGAVDYQYVSIFAPKMTASGRYRLSPEGRDEAEGEPWIDLEQGSGMALRQVSNVDLSKLLKGWVRIAPISTNAGDGEPDVMPVINLFVANGDEIKHRAAFFRDGRMVGGEIEIDTSFTLDLLDEPSKCCDISIPISGRIPDLGRQVEGTIRLVEHIQSFKLLDVLSPGDRFLAGFKKTPVHNRFLIEFDLVIDENGSKNTVSGTGFADSVQFK